MTASDKSLMKDVYASIVFLTRFPAPGWPAAAKRPLAGAMWAFPLAGVLVAWGTAAWRRRGERPDAEPDLVDLGRK